MFIIFAKIVERNIILELLLLNKKPHKKFKSYEVFYYLNYVSSLKDHK